MKHKFKFKEYLTEGLTSETALKVAGVISKCQALRNIKMEVIPALV